MTRKIKITAFDASKYLKTEQDIAEYLKASLEEGGYGLFVEALGDVAKARGISQLAKEAGVPRESLYKSLSADGNPSFKTICKITAALGLAFEVIPGASHIAPS